MEGAVGPHLGPCQVQLEQPAVSSLEPGGSTHSAGVGCREVLCLKCPSLSAGDASFPHSSVGPGSLSSRQPFGAGAASLNSPGIQEAERGRSYWIQAILLLRGAPLVRAQELLPDLKGKPA